LGVGLLLTVLANNDKCLNAASMKIFTDNKLSIGLSQLLKNKKVSHFEEKEQFRSDQESSSYLNHFTDAQVSEIAELVYLKK
tara:strand:+ start:84 stop:329 length:246 start_codon:yes stop_codon:yes gene_type:complete